MPVLLGIFLSFTFPLQCICSNVKFDLSQIFPLYNLNDASEKDTNPLINISEFINVLPKFSHENNITSFLDGRLLYIADESITNKDDGINIEERLESKLNDWVTNGCLIARTELYSYELCIGKHIAQSWLRRRSTNKFQEVNVNGFPLYYKSSHSILRENGSSILFFQEIYKSDQVSFPHEILVKYECEPNLSRLPSFIKEVIRDPVDNSTILIVKVRDLCDITEFAYARNAKSKCYPLKLKRDWLHYDAEYLKALLIRKAAAWRTMLLRKQEDYYKVNEKIITALISEILEVRIVADIDVYEAINLFNSWKDILYTSSNEDLERLFIFHYFMDQRWSWIDYPKNLDYVDAVNGHDLLIIETLVREINSEDPTVLISLHTRLSNVPGILPDWLENPEKKLLSFLRGRFPSWISFEDYVGKNHNKYSELRSLISDHESRNDFLRLFRSKLRLNEISLDTFIIRIAYQLAAVHVFVQFEEQFIDSEWAEWDVIVKYFYQEIVEIVFKEKGFLLNRPKPLLYELAKVMDSQRHKLVTEVKNMFWYDQRDEFKRLGRHALYRTVML